MARTSAWPCARRYATQPRARYAFTTASSRARPRTRLVLPVKTRSVSGGREEVLGVVAHRVERGADLPRAFGVVGEHQLPVREGPRGGPRGRLEELVAAVEVQGDGHAEDRGDRTDGEQGRHALTLPRWVGRGAPPFA